MKNLLLILFASLPALSLAADAPHRPNFIVFIADDLGCDETSPYGNNVVRTPNMQRVADEGMRFDRFFLTASSCSPSRSSLLSGLYPHNTGAENLHEDMKPSVELLVEPLKAAGYYSMLIGKSHGTNAPGVRKKFDRMVPPDGAKPWTMGDKWEKALRDRPKDKPFFMWAASIDPHRPYKQGTFKHPQDPAKVIVPPYYPDIPEMREELADYYDELSRFDEHIGQAIKVLEEQKILDDTVIIVMTDNGRPFPQAKTRVNAEGLKSPFLIRYPSVIKAGSSTKSLASAVDLAPTLLDLAAAPAMRHSAGVSLVPVLRDPALTVRSVTFGEHNWHNYRAFERVAITANDLYIRNWLPEFSNPPPAEVAPMPAYQAMWKLFEDGKLPASQSDGFIAPRPAEELFDINNDPNCMRNLATDPASKETLERLREELNRWQESSNDVFAGIENLKKDDFNRRTGIKFKKDGNGHGGS